VDGEEIAGLGDKALTRLRRDRLGFVFQAFNLVPVLSAEENILLPLTLAGRKPEREWFDRLIAGMGLGDRLSHRPDELSGGQQQRVAVARALVAKPSVVLADEPTAALDRDNAASLMDQLAALARESGMAALVSTHDQRCLDRVDRVIRLENGALS
ncbi:MAG: ATP-binding cassette domain-containing protein, partial [Duganella sp.]